MVRMVYVSRAFVQLSVRTLVNDLVSTGDDSRLQKSKMELKFN